MQLEGASAVQVSTPWTVEDDLQSTNMSFASTCGGNGGGSYDPMKAIAS